MTSTTRLFLLLVAATAMAACSFDPSGVYYPAGDDDQPGPDANDVGPAVEDEENDNAPESACEEWRTRHFDPCSIPQPGEGLALDSPGTYLYDSDTGTLTDPLGQTFSPPSAVVAQAVGPDVRVLSLGDVTVGEQALLRAVGSAPLIVASWAAIDVRGTIDASSRTDSSRGAGADPVSCELHAPGEGGVSIFSGGGGGGGAGFGSAGGSGGNGGWGIGGGGGAAVGLPGFVRGGCAGADGGAGRLFSVGGAGGGGGGALYLVARREIAVYGSLVANGSGGRRGDRALLGVDSGGDQYDHDSAAGGGGGGGGAGGMVGFEAPTVVFGPDAVITANGGGAGEGGDLDNGGAPGSDGLAASQEAPGGSGFALQGGDGGGGGYDLAPLGKNGVLAYLGGGGGGGGGVGFVVIDAETSLVPSSAIVTPPPVQP